MMCWRAWYCAAAAQHCSFLLPENSFPGSACEQHLHNTARDPAGQAQQEAGRNRNCLNCATPTAAAGVGGQMGGKEKHSLWQKAQASWVDLIKSVRQLRPGAASI